MNILRMYTIPETVEEFRAKLAKLGFEELENFKKVLNARYLAKYFPIYEEASKHAGNLLYGNFPMMKNIMEGKYVPTEIVPKEITLFVIDVLMTKPSMRETDVVKYIHRFDIYVFYPLLSEEERQMCFDIYYNAGIYYACVEPEVIEYGKRKYGNAFLSKVKTTKFPLEHKIEVDSVSVSKIEKEIADVAAATGKHIEKLRRIIETKQRRIDVHKNTLDHIKTFSDIMKK